MYSNCKTINTQKEKGNVWWQNKIVSDPLWEWNKSEAKGSSILVFMPKFMNPPHYLSFSHISFLSFMHFISERKTFPLAYILVTNIIYNRRGITLTISPSQRLVTNIIYDRYEITLTICPSQKLVTSFIDLKHHLQPIWDNPSNLPLTKTCNKFHGPRKQYYDTCRRKVEEKSI